MAAGRRLTLLLVGVAGLSAFQARIDPALSWAAFGLFGVGLVVAAVGFVGAWLGRDGFWDFGALGVVIALVGTLFFAILTYQTSALSRRAALLLAAGRCCRSRRCCSSNRSSSLRP
jgi:FtsH-binding integral membrane protein